MRRDICRRHVVSLGHGTGRTGAARPLDPPPVPAPDRFSRPFASRSLRKAASCQLVATKTVRHQQVSFLPLIGFKSRRSRQFCPSTLHLSDFAEYGRLPMEKYPLANNSLYTQRSGRFWVSMQLSLKNSPVIPPQPCWRHPDSGPVDTRAARIWRNALTHRSASSISTA